MSVNKIILSIVPFHTVDGLYLQENDVEHVDYILIEELTEWFEDNPQDITRADVMELAISGGNARRCYSIYEKFVDAASVLDKLPEPEPEPMHRDSTNQLMTDTEKYQLLTQIMILVVRINAETSFRAEVQYGNEFDELHLKIDENIGFYESLKIRFADKIIPLPYQIQTEAYAETFNRNLYQHLKNAVSVLTGIVETKKMNRDDFAYIDADELHDGVYGYYVF